jgi:uncharacterized cupin superfamily protein
MNLFADEWDETDETDGYRGRWRTVGKTLEAKRIGGSLYELDPGSRVCPYHYHFAEEEWLLVVAGEPTLRTPDGTRRLAPWDVVAFPRGPAGGHDVRNETDEPVRVLMLSSLSEVEVCVYPDSGKIGAWGSAGGEKVRLLNRPDANLAYLDGEEGG